MANVRAVVFAAVLAATVGTAPVTAAPAEAVWTVTHPGNAWAGVDSVTAFPDGTAWTVYDSEDSGILGDSFARTTDYGATWTEHPAPAGLLPAAMAMNTPARGFALAQPVRRDEDDRRDVYDGAILATTDGWRSSRPHRLPRPPGVDGLHWPQMSASRGGTSAVLVGQPYRIKGPFIHGIEVVWVTGGGRTTRRTRLPARGGWATVSVLDDRNAVVALARWTGEAAVPYSTECCDRFESAFYVTGDAGRTWRLATLLPDEIVTTVDYVAAGHVVAVGYEGGVLVSRDGARRFARVGEVRLTPYPDWTHPPGASIDFVTPRVGYAATCHSGQWRTVDGGETWDLELSPNHGEVMTDPRCHAGRTVAAFDAERAVSVFHAGFLTRTRR